MDSYADIKITNLKKDPILREHIHISEEKIRDNIGDSYNNTMNHQTKIKDTKKTILPVAGSYNDEKVLLSTTQSYFAQSLFDPYHNEYYNRRMDLMTKYTEEMLKAKNMMMKKKEGAK